MGGVQTPTVIKSAGIQAGSTFDGIFHITDWFATFGNIAGYKPEGETDSIDQLEALKVLNFQKSWSWKVTLEKVIDSTKVFKSKPNPNVILNLILNIIFNLIFRIHDFLKIEG